MQLPEKRLQELGIILPECPTPAGNYVPFVFHDNLLFLSGQGPILDDGTKATGKVGLDVTAEQAYEHAICLAKYLAPRENTPAQQLAWVPCPGR